MYGANYLGSNYYGQAFYTNRTLFAVATQIIITTAKRLWTKIARPV